MENLLQLEKPEKKANFAANNSVTLTLTAPVQIRAKAYTDDGDKSAHNLWNFLEWTFKKSNEQAIQNVRCLLASLVYVKETDWDKHLNMFNALIAWLATQNA